jgi:uncharacterized Rossmann fold enzyme
MMQSATWGMSKPQKRDDEPDASTTKKKLEAASTAIRCEKKKGETIP